MKSLNAKSLEAVAIEERDLNTDKKYLHLGWLADWFYDCLMTAGFQYSCNSNTIASLFVVVNRTFIGSLFQDQEYNKLIWALYYSIALYISIIMN